MSNTYNFEAETERLLELLTHSIYSNKEIFLRELISNASDAIDKARIKSLTDTNYLGVDSNFEIKVYADSEKNTITIEDNGIGMTEIEAQKHLGTIAKSGTKDFIEKLKESKQENSLIGQFGVGFYSAFMVADKVEVHSKSNESDKSIIWSSAGKGQFEISSGEKIDRGTKVVLFLKQDELEFLQEWKLRELIKKYSNYVGIPIKMLEVENDQNKDKRNFEQINETKAVWTKNKSDLTDEDYNKFYSEISYDFNKPLTHIHITTEGVISYKSILFVPSEKNMFKNNDDPTQNYGPKLFVKNVLILENAKDLLPVYFRFISGVVETSDLPLNISREMLQSNPTLEKIKKGLTKKVIEKLKFEMSENKENYDKFLNNFGKILKEGVYYDSENKEKIAEVIKFYSNLKSKNITLDEYLETAQISKKTVSEDNSESETAEKQITKNIYYILAKSLSEAKANPYLEQFNKNNIDVLILTDSIDEWLVQSLSEYKGNKLISITSNEVELEEAKTPEETTKIEETKKDFKDLLELAKNTIGNDKLEKVELTQRLGESIGALSSKSGSLTPQMEKMMKAMGQPVPTQKRVLELNPNNVFVQNMLEEFKKDLKSEKLKDMMMYAYEQAILLEGGELEDIKGFVSRVNKYMK